MNFPIARLLPHAAGIKVSKHVFFWQVKTNLYVFKWQ